MEEEQKYPEGEEGMEFDSEEEPESEEDIVQDGELQEDEEGEGDAQVYLPGGEIGEGEGLVMDRTAYVCHAEFQTEWPCLTVDILPDALGAGEARSRFPMTTYMISGTQAQSASANAILVMKASNIRQMQEDEEDEEEEEEGSGDPVLEVQSIAHRGGVNRVRVAPHDASVVFPHESSRVVAASWSDTGRVHIWDISGQLAALDGVARERIEKPVFTYEGHKTEGFAVDWSPVKPLRLATGDCDKFIHLWDPHEGGVWSVSKQQGRGHESSVEDIQFSPNEADVFASCSSDQTLRIWDCRQAAKVALSIHAHESDVNVISWNPREQHLMVSGADDGSFKVWDLRTFGADGAEPVAAFHWHTEPITSIQWYPQDASVIAVGGADDQVSIWDLAVEEDPEAGVAQVMRDGAALPPQLLFVHQGQSNIKDVRWHPQIPGVIVSTAESGFNIFKSISV